MVKALRYLGYYWLAISALILLLYDWFALGRLPNGSDVLEIVLFVPGILFVVASFVIGFMQRGQEADAAKRLFPNGVPKNLLNDTDNTVSNMPVGAASHQGAKAGNRSRLVSPNLITPTPAGNAQSTNLAMEQASDALISIVVKNAAPLQRAALLLAEADPAIADGLSQIVEATETLAVVTQSESG